ncbi:hypothetical protein EG329_001014 [Mollisiaceae sp. DMI_Dod_QoI]|nr:hypothetical protein EG329_001014 [Helotiales sp. DMI_Dod_QoI]
MEMEMEEEGWSVGKGSRSDEEMEENSQVAGRRSQAIGRTGKGSERDGVCVVWPLRAVGVARRQALWSRRARKARKGQEETRTDLGQRGGPGRWEMGQGQGHRARLAGQASTLAATGRPRVTSTAGRCTHRIPEAGSGLAPLTHDSRRLSHPPTTHNGGDANGCGSLGVQCCCYRASHPVCAIKFSSRGVRDPSRTLSMPRSPFLATVWLCSASALAAAAAASGTKGARGAGLTAQSNYS